MQLKTDDRRLKPSLRRQLLRQQPSEPFLTLRRPYCCLLRQQQLDSVQTSQHRCSSCTRCVEFLSASGEVLTFHSDFDFACLEGLESLKVDNIKPQKIASSSLMATVPYSGTSSFHHRDESWVCMVWPSGLRRLLQATVYLLPKELVEKVAELHFSALHSPYSGTRRLHRRQG